MSNSIKVQLESNANATDHDVEANSRSTNRSQTKGVTYHGNDDGSTNHWHAMTKEDAIAKLGLDPSTIRETGLTTEQAKMRLEEHGPNQLTQKEKVTLFQRIWHQVNNALVAILLIVAAVSVVRAATDDPVTNSIQVAIILSVIGINTTIGILQEGSAEKAAEALKALLSSDAIVVRNGREVEVPGTEVVPGDIVILSLGDRIPADMRIIQANNLACQEAALTGEAVPVDKLPESIETDGNDPTNTPLGDRHNMAFSATHVAQGSGAGIVVSTGDDTEIGTINALVNKVESKKTNVLKQIDTVSKILALFIVVTAVVTFCVAFFTVDSVDGDALEAISIALVTAVAMIPEGLEAIVTVTYAWAVSNMATQNAIIRALPAVETLGSVTVICSDKTGTLTQNIMSLTAFVTSNGRYKVDVDSKERTSSNFVRDDSFLAGRADPLAMAGKRTDEPNKPKVIDELEAEMADGVESANGRVNQDGEEGPIANGQSPDIGFLKSSLATGVLCSKCTLGTNGTREGEIGNPTELSILRASYAAGIDVEGMKTGSPIIAEVPFSSEYKFMATVHEPREENDGPNMDGKLVVHVKGAPDRMIPLCTSQSKAGVVGETEPLNKEYWQEQIAVLSSHGLRVIALLRGTLPEGAVTSGQQLGPEFVLDPNAGPSLAIVGLCAIMDPPRPECVDAVAEAHKAGVRIAMITGDHKDTALAIGSMLGLVDKKHSSAITGPELDSMDDDEVKRAVMKHNVFARASPQNKIRIVKALQSQGEVCGMTGDGVNDAPALKAADMGVAMGKEGTDVAREASDMILADDNFATIISAVREGRVVWDNLRKVLLVNTPINNAQGLSVLFGLVFGLEETPLTAIQVLYCNLICAVTLGFVCAVEPAEGGIMDVEPRRVGKRLIGRYLLLRIILGTATLVAVTVGATFWAQTLGYSLEAMRSQALNTLTFGAIAITLSARFATSSSFHTRLIYGNKFAWYAVAIVAALQAIITYTPGLNEVVFSMGPMDFIQWLIVMLFMVVVFTVMELEKALRRILKQFGEDTNDDEYGIFDDRTNPNQDISLPKGASRLSLATLIK